MEKTITHGLPPIARTLFVPVACRALESKRPDALLNDPRSVWLFQELGGDPGCLMGMSELDQTFTIMRTRQFDDYARTFLDAHPQGLVVDIGCGLNTRFDRIDHGQMRWLGLDLPEVIELRRRLLPDGDRCQTIAKSMLEITWLEIAAQINRPIIFLAEGVFPYFTEAQVKSVITAMSERFANGELVFDALTSFSLGLHSRHPVLGETGARLDWSVDNPRKLESWGLRLLDHWNYFNKPEPRIGLAYLMRFFQPLKNATTILHYCLGADNVRHASNN